jgi:TonB family protein
VLGLDTRACAHADDYRIYRGRFRSKLKAMRRYPLSLFPLAVAVAFTCGNVECLAQDVPKSGPPLNDVILLEPGEVTYPPLARQAGIAGDVELQVEVRSDGGVQSAVVIKGPYLLQDVALASARETKFECRNCNQDVVSSRIVYTFELTMPADPCNTAKSPTHTQLAQPNAGSDPGQNRVSVTVEALLICDPAVKLVRSVKCLYLWRCGTRPAF